MNIKKIQKLVGPVTGEQLAHVDCFVADKMGIFVPCSGPCLYSTSPIHSHPAYMFMLTHDSYCRIKISGAVKQSEHGRLYAVSPGVPHQELPYEDTPETFSRFTAIMLDAAFFESQLADYGISATVSWEAEEFPVAPDLITFVKEFMIESESMLPAREKLLNAIALKITHSLIRLMFHIVPEHERITTRAEIDRVTEYMHANYKNRIPVKKLARLVPLSESHFSRVFKSETGKSPLDYLIDLRLGKAKKLLRAGGKSITRIAIDCGFGSSAHFSSCFSQRFKISPSDFKKK